MFRPAEQNSIPAKPPALFWIFLKSYSLVLDSGLDEMTASEPFSPITNGVPHDLDQERKDVASTSSTALQEKTKDEPIAAQNVSHTPEKHEWITGIKLAIIITAITLVTLLMLLDTSIVVTVSLPQLRLYLWIAQ